MKSLFILLVLAGVVWCKPPQPLPEKITIILTPQEPRNSSNESEEIFSGILGESDETHPKIPNRLNTTSTTPPLTTDATLTSEKSGVHVDLSQRLFYASNQDLQFGRKTLDLSGLDLNDEDVKRILHGLDAATLASVTRLDLSRNRVWGLPSRVWPLELEYTLRDLRLDHNPLHMGDPELRRTTRFELLRLLSLKTLSLAHCGLTSSDSSATLEYPSVESLDLSYNRLVDLPDSLTNMASLRHLDLSGNNIHYLGQTPLSSLLGLRTLNLSGNGLERMWDDPFEKLYYLETIRLDHNSLTEPPRLYQYTGSYQPPMDVFLANNSFHCGCAFKSILDHSRVQIMDKVNVSCVDGDSAVWSVDSDLAHQCSPHWEVVRERWTGAQEWFRDNRPDWSTLYRSLGWVLFGVTLGLVYAHRRARKTPPPAQVPYNILDDGIVC